MNKYLFEKPLLFVAIELFIQFSHITGNQYMFEYKILLQLQKCLPTQKKNVIKSLGRYQYI